MALVDEGHVGGCPMRSVDLFPWTSAVRFAGGKGAVQALDRTKNRVLRPEYPCSFCIHQVVGGPYQMHWPSP
jgi:hypothetical protein